MADTYNEDNPTASTYDVEIDSTPVYLTNTDGQEKVYARTASASSAVNFYGNHTVSWGIEYNEGFQYSSDYGGYISYGQTTIKRNGKDFYTVRGEMKYSIPKAISIIDDLRNDEEIDWFAIDYQDQIIGRNVVYKRFPAVIKNYYEGTGIVEIGYDEDRNFDDSTLSRIARRWGFTKGETIKVDIVGYGNNVNINWWSEDETDDEFDDGISEYQEEVDNSVYE